MPPELDDDHVAATCRVLVAHGVQFLVIGGVAARLQHTGHATVDIDVSRPRPKAAFRRFRRVCSCRAGVGARVSCLPPTHLGATTKNVDGSAPETLPPTDHAVASRRTSAFSAALPSVTGTGSSWSLRKRCTSRLAHTYFAGSALAPIGTEERGDAMVLLAARRVERFMTCLARELCSELREDVASGMGGTRAVG